MNFFASFCCPRTPGPRKSAPAVEGANHTSARQYHDTPRNSSHGSGVLMGRDGIAPDIRHLGRATVAMAVVSLWESKSARRRVLANIAHHVPRIRSRCKNIRHACFFEQRDVFVGDRPPRQDQ